eukprot:gnl/MRDRNA2_/MRDRNA2_108397_c0_seq1.p1 gnl/MRDRNA2_/MRDRNA2_108397_c0~~gnl/MRDRNA2_/MRDRNA2_108397_c0_seq1.p1  ORF type:complete len:217 (+),score=19.51 gnl/MRDRNA2_/MRDRNA2_108397_c0_seq1:139-789(+)
MATNLGIEDEDCVFTAPLLRNAAGVIQNIFPKTYRVKITTGFYLYVLVLTLMVIGASLYEQFDVYGKFVWDIFVFDVAYILFIVGMIFWFVPRLVIRENERLILVFWCRKWNVPLDSIIEVRIVRRRKGKNIMKCKEGLCCRYPTKCFWGYPTNFDKNIVVVTDTTCNNYFFSLYDMEDFIADNSPCVEMAPPQPQIMGSLTSMPSYCCRPTNCHR